jgi:hypothetical protein
VAAPPIRGNFASESQIWVVMLPVMKLEALAAVGILAVGAALVAPDAWACPGVDLRCGDAGYITVWEEDNDDQCSSWASWTYPGADLSFEAWAPAGQQVYVDARLDSWRYWYYWEPDVDLFVYDRTTCTDWGNISTCLTASWELGFATEHVTFLSDGGIYHAVVDEFYGWDYGIVDYDIYIQMGCAKPCNPAIAQQIYCSTVFDNQPVGASDVLDYYVCGDPYDHLIQDRPETIYSFVPQQTGWVTFNLTDMSADFDIYILEGACDQDECIASSTWHDTLDDSIDFYAQANTTYYIVIEAFWGYGTYDLSFDDGMGIGGCPEDCSNTLDDNGNGLIDCEDTTVCCPDPVCTGHPACCDDGDGDLYDDWTCGGTDCNDANAAINPGATEICDGVDNNCDTLVDNGLTAPLANDQDGICAGSRKVCAGASGWVEPDYTTLPGYSTTDYCDGLDNDCDVAVDENASFANWYNDQDGDGYGAGAADWTCDPDPGDVLSATDCNDSPADLDGDGHPDGWDTWPGAPETCDGRDNDCDQTVDEGTPCYDDDGDGFTENSGDCDDAWASTWPGGTETCNSRDDDCNGTVDDHSTCWDDDGDCYCENAPCAGSSDLGCTSPAGGDCNDGDAAVNPGQTEIDGDGFDNDCDGSVDDGTFDPDGDGYTVTGGDCVEYDATAYPGAPEEADGVDDDCDTVVDEGTVAFDDDADGWCEGIDLDADGADDCSDGTTPGDCHDGDPAVNPGAAEVGNGIDDNCDGQIDEGGDYADDDGDGFSENEGDCDDANAGVFPGAAEVANDIDDDCDGDSDEGFHDLDGDGVTVEEGDCDDGEGWVRPGLIEMCDGLDNNCDGRVDEECVLPPTELGGCRCAVGAGSVLPFGWWLGALVLVLAGCRRDFDVHEVNAELELAEDLVDMGDVLVGDLVSFTLQLDHVGGPTVQVDQVDVFNVEGDAVSFVGEVDTVASNQSAVLDMVFNPQTEGYRHAVVTITSDAALSPELVAHVRGHAMLPDVVAWPFLLDFGRVTPPEFATLALTVANQGDLDAEVDGARFTDADAFALVQTLPVTVPAGDSVDLEVTFAPPDEHPRAATMELDVGPAFRLGPIDLRGNACAFGNPELYDIDDDGFADCGDDCDDDDPAIHPGAPEVVDGDDQDCDGLVDEGTGVYDDDGDCSCETPPCTGTSSTDCTTLGFLPDCNDGEPLMGPAILEVPENGIDDDCDGVVDHGTTDLDGDGYGPGGGDCEDGDATVYPGAPELADGIDNNCDGLGPAGAHIADEGTVLYDDDGDGYCESPAVACTDGALLGDCDDRDIFGVVTHPNATELIDGQDNDCDSDVDEGTDAFDDDGDGFTEEGGDCNDANSAVNPAQTEIPGNGHDDDCNPATSD